MQDGTLYPSITTGSFIPSLVPPPTHRASKDGRREESLLRLHIRISARCSGRWNDLEMTTARRRDLHVAVNPGRRADDAFRSGEFVAQGLGTATAHRWRLALDVRRARRPLLGRRVLGWLRQPRTHRGDADERGNDQNGRTQRQFLADLQSVVVNVSRREGFPRAGSGERASGR